jgi:DNA-binding NarL/FixJ family response regulator/anti-sigma regulatory factor (Ser/Thr protein kinase)
MTDTLPGPGGDDPSIPLAACASDEATTVLVVDDSSFDRQLVGQLLGPMPDIRVVYATDGRTGLEAIAREAPSVILTDLVMPDMGGLELVQQVRAEHPEISVVLMTAFGSEDVAMQTLRAGAANYIPKRDLARDLPSTLRRVLNVACLTRLRGRILRCLVRRESVFRLQSDPAIIAALLELIREELDGLEFGDPTGRIQITIALQEALTNALYHGNLELSTDLRQQDEKVFDDLAECRMVQEPYGSRHIRVQVQLDRDAVRFVVADDGPGFDTAVFDRPVQPDDLTRIGGRGLLLIRTFMDQVSFNSIGNQITMVKDRS